MPMLKKLVGALALAAVLAGCGAETAAPTAPPTESTPATAAASTAVPPTSAPAMTTAGPSATAGASTASVSDTVTFQQPPEWARGALIYQLFVRTFTPEGTLAAATARLPELRDFGAEIIYLLPIHPTGVEKRKGSLGSPYSVRDYRAIDPALGTEQDFRAFVDTAHELGMRVILDLVANHTAWDNPLIAEHPDWYTRNTAGDIIPPNPEWTDVADLNYENDELRQYMIDTSLFWVNEFGIDGYRCDVADSVPSDFWLAWRAALTSAQPDLLLLSESGGVQMYAAGFEVAYDWTTRTEFINGLLTPNLARRAFSNVSFEQKQYGPEMWRMRYLENHDHDRIGASALQPGQRAVAAAFLLTLPGLPLIYAGQEVGATERPTLFDPFTVDFAGGDQALRETYRELIQLRRTSPALRANTFERVQAQARTVLLYERAAPEQRVLVAINMDDEAAQVTPENIATGRDIRTGETVDFSAGITLEPFGYRLFEIGE